MSLFGINLNNALKLLTYYLDNYYVESYLMKYFIFLVCEGVTNETLEWRPYDKCHRCQKHQQPSKQQNQTRCTEITNYVSLIYSTIR